MNILTKSKSVLPLKKPGTIRPTTLFLVVLLLAFFLIGLIFMLGTRTDLSTAQRRMTDIVYYIREQCIMYDNADAEEQTKSLIQVADKAQMFREYYEDSRFYSDEAAVMQFIGNQRLEAILITDAETDETLFYQTEKRTSPDWSEILKTAATAMDNPAKCYTNRLVPGDGYCYDYAVVGRTDRRGLILCYARQKEADMAGTELSIRTLLTGYDTELDNIVIVTDGIIVIGSNDKTLGSLPASECPLIKDLRNDPTFDELIPISTENGDFYAIRSKSKRYFVYVLSPKSEVFSTRTSLVFYTITLYTILAVITITVHQNQETRRRLERASNIEKYNIELDRLANDAIRANEAKADFLRKISHDIRTPVNGICGMIDIADYYDDDPAKRKECYQKIRSSSKYLLDLVSDVLDMSKMEQGIFPWKDEPFCLDTVIEQIYAIMRQQVEERGQIFRSAPTELAHIHLIGAPLTIKRIMINIIGNAMKYNKPHGIVSVSFCEIASDDTTASYRFICEDTGYGMSREFQAHMFEPFAQEQASPTSRYEGTGLGLAIVQKLLEQMKGSIQVDSVPNEGTTVEISFRMPFDPQASAVQTTRPQSDTTAQPTTPLAGRKILLVEDNELNTEIAAFFLQNAGAECLNCANGKEAVRLFCASAPGEIDAILMDVMMPVMDGLDATRAVRAADHPNAATVPIIAMTANAYADDIDRAKKAGMNAYLAKPLDAHKLVSTLCACLRPRV